MSAWIASSKFNGWSETGLAFGMNYLPMTRLIARSSLNTSSEHVSAVAYSASCYDWAGEEVSAAVLRSRHELRGVHGATVATDRGR